MQKHIVIINNGLAGGGIERASVSLANYFQSKGYKLSVIALYQSAKFFQLNEGIRFYEPAFSRDQVNKFMYLLRMIFYIRKSVKKLKPDTILSFGEWTNPYVVLALTALNYPLFISDRMSPLAKLPTISSIFRRIFYKRATGIIAQSNFAKIIVQKKTRANNIHVIYNPVNCIEKVECTLKNRLVCIGRLEEVKGHKFLIQAFAKANIGNWELSIVGDGSLMKELKNQVENLGISNRVIFHGHLSDFRLQVSEAEIFVLPSLREGFPNALIEAMSVPLACIATDTFYGYHEIIENGINGILVEPGNVEDLTQAIERLVFDKKQREFIKENAFKIREDLKFERIAKKYLDIIISEA